MMRFLISCLGLVLCTNTVTAALLFGPFDSKPYISPTKTPGNSVCISWNTTNPDSTIVAYGLTAALTDTVRGTGVENYHHAMLQGLTPFTTYYYRVLPAGDLKTFNTFAATSDSFFFCALGDTRTDSVAHQSVIDRMASFPFEFFIHSGDLVARGDSTDLWKTFFNIEDTILQSKQFLPSIGNHETPFWQYDTLFLLPDSEDYYSVDYANCHFVALNTSMDLAGFQKTWLISDLSMASINPSIDWIFAFFHRPPYSSGISHGSQLDVQAEWCPVFEQYSVVMVITGHDHIYERTIPINGVVYIVTGGGGAPLCGISPHSWTAYAESTYHFCWLKVKGKRLEFYAIKPDGTIFDSLIIEKPVGVAGPDAGGFFGLSARPNPFSKKINISYSMHDAGSVIKEHTLKVYDISGRIVRDLSCYLVSGIKDHKSIVSWSGDDGAGCFLPAGVYFAVVENSYQRFVAKIIKEE